MRKILFFVFVLLVAESSLFANTDERTWILNSGETFRAAQMGYDNESGEVLLMLNSTEQRTVSLSELSEADKKWLTEWLAAEKEMDELVQQLGGRFEHAVAEGTFKTDIYIYYPTASQTNDHLPLLILFNAGGKAAGYVKHFAEAAEQIGIVVVGCGSFYNTKDAALEDEMSARFQELLPILEATIPHDPARLFMGGNSGGAMRAYGYTAEVDRPWAGIYANAGWLGGYDAYGLPYPSGMRIALVNGEKDHANRWLSRDRKLLEFRGNHTRLFTFDGGHERAPSSIRAEALRWLIEGDAL